MNNSTYYECLDQIISLDAGGRGVGELYRAARAHTEEPLVRAAARRLAGVGRQANVLITTGSVSRTWVSASIGENDGPPGAAVIARALAMSRMATSYVVAEESLLEGIAQVFTRAGLTVVDEVEADRYRPEYGRLAMAVMMSLPTEDEAAVQASERILDSVRPDLVISTERAGRNKMGVYHNARGMDYGAGRARVDLLVELAEKRLVPIVAIGDGGNEIGMGLIAETVRDVIPFGRECVCGCGGGIGAEQGADVLVTAGCSNWGCYGIVAALAMEELNTSLLHTAAFEVALLDAAATAGLIDSTSGLSSACVDGLPSELHQAVVTAINEVARLGIEAA